MLLKFAEVESNAFGGLELSQGRIRFRPEVRLAGERLSKDREEEPG
jgi:hypothetical protein